MNFSIAVPICADPQFISAIDTLQASAALTVAPQRINVP